MPRSDQPRLVRAYVADHLLLLRAARDLARRVRGRSHDRELCRLLDEVLAEVSRQEAVAVSFLRQLGAGPPWLRLALGSVTERIGRLKPNGRLLRPSPLAPVFELEVLVSLLEMTARFWRTLEDAGIAAGDVVAPRAEEAERLVPRLERCRQEAGAHALQPLGAG